MVASVLMSLALGISGQGGDVKLLHDASGWTLHRNGEPYVVRGVGGTDQMEKLKALGGNSVRTWGAERLGEELDRAHALGMTVCAGIWLGHVGHGFDYGDPKRVQEQAEMVRRVVQQHKGHPALLFWALGNEMEINNDNDRLWSHVNDLAKIVKSIDPGKPVMTVVAEVSPEKIERLNRLAPELDVLGVNSYGGLPTLPERLKQFGWTRPYVVTEFGPLGPWERPKTDWNAALEQTSSEKADFYLANWKHSIDEQQGWCLGSYAFLWGHKQEATPTWFGMFLPTGETVGSVDVMSYAWTGTWPEQRAPVLESVSVSAQGKKVAPSSTVTASARATDQNKNTLTFEWVLKNEVTELGYAGEGEKTPEPIRTVGTTASITFTAPATPGPYRLYLTVRDGTGRAATANAPFFVER